MVFSHRNSLITEVVAAFKITHDVSIIILARLAGSFSIISFFFFFGQMSVARVIPASDPTKRRRRYPIGGSFKIYDQPSTVRPSNPQPCAQQRKEKRARMALLRLRGSIKIIIRVYLHHRSVSRVSLAIVIFTRRGRVVVKRLHLNFPSIDSRMSEAGKAA